MKILKSNYSFYNSIDLIISDKQIIVYPDRDAVLSYKNFKEQDLKNYIEQIINDDSQYFGDMSYAIAFLWNFEGDKMVDFWKFNANYVDDRSGPLADVRIYRNMKLTPELGAASGNTLLVLGIEEKLRRKSKDLISYLKGPAPKLPFGVQVAKDIF